MRRRRRLGENVEQLGDALRGHPDAVVLDGDLDFQVHARGPQRDLSAGMGVLRRVVQQIRQHLRDADRVGIELDRVSPADFEAALKRGNHTLKRALTDPRLISGIGNAYSDEILHRARLSPVTLTSRLTSDESARLFAATREVLGEWLARLRTKAHGEFPSKVTAFHGEMAVHGKYGKPCPVCGAPVQRIVYAENETNYCARCQTGGKILADRALSRLLKKSWPRSLEKLG